MSDVSMAVEQDAIAESLLGDPTEEQPTEQTGTEQAEVVQVAEPSVEAEGEQPQEQAEEDWLPTDQDKVFPDDVYARYAQRYQLTPEQAADPLLRQLLHDKINTDIFVRSQIQQQEEIEQEQIEEPQQEPTQPQITRDQYFQNLDRVIAERTDPQVAKDFHDGFLRVFGVPEAEIAKAPPQQAMALTSLMSKYALNLFNTFAGDMLQAQLGPQLTQMFPNFGEMYERSAYAMAWDKTRNSNPAYASLPAYGTKEFKQTLREASNKFPELMAAFQDETGKIPVTKAASAYGLLAKIASGQTVDPQIVQRAAAAGARNATRAASRKANGNLGSGQSRAASTNGSSRFQTNSDLFDDETMDLYKREHGRI